VAACLHLVRDDMQGSGERQHRVAPARRCEHPRGAAGQRA